jgi:general secretion pathway protein I
MQGHDVTGRQKGFTLIEVLAAFSVFTLSIGALYEIFSVGQSRTARAAERVRNLMTAQSILEEWRSTGPVWKSGLSEGRTDSGDMWRISVELLASDAPSSGRWRAYRVSITVPVGSRRPVQLQTIELGREQ